MNDMKFGILIDKQNAVDAFLMAPMEPVFSLGPKEALSIFLTVTLACVSAELTPDEWTDRPDLAFVTVTTSGRVEGDLVEVSRYIQDRLHDTASLDAAPYIQKTNSVDIIIKLTQGTPEAGVSLVDLLGVMRNHTGGAKAAATAAKIADVVRDIAAWRGDGELYLFNLAFNEDGRIEGGTFGKLPGEPDRTDIGNALMALALLMDAN